MSKKTWFAGIVAIAIVIPVSFSQAAQYLPNDRENAGAVVVGGAQEFRNLYTAGGSVVVEKQILGDLFVAGGSVTVVNPVGDDARIAGGNVTINAPVNGDLLVAAGTLALTENAHVNGDWWAAGGIVNFNGTVGGNAKVIGGEVFINGTIMGPVKVHAGKKLTFGPQSKVTGPITYSGPTEAVVQDGAHVGQIEFTRIAGKSAAARSVPAAVAVILAGIGILFFFKLATLLVASLVLLKLFGRTSLEIVSSARDQFWQNLGIGFVAMIAIPLAAILLMATLIGAYLGVALGIWFAFTILMTGTVTVMLAGTLTQTWISKKELPLSWKTILWGILGIAILMLIPFIGWLAILILYLASFGALLQTARQRVEV